MESILKILQESGINLLYGILILVMAHRRESL